MLVIRTPDERLIWLQALGSRRKEDVTVVVADDFDVTGERSIAVSADDHDGAPWPPG